MIKSVFLVISPNQFLTAKTARIPATPIIQ
jgi:hypothetical protein